MQTRVLVDANVLYSRTLRDWLIMIEVLGGPYKVYWSEDILAEALYHLRREHPDWDGGKIASIRAKIVDALEGGRVEDFVVDGSFPGDPHDRHVHAAALACHADIVLTADSGFTDQAMADALPYEVYLPDAFFVLVDDSTPHVVRNVARRQAIYYYQRYGSADLCASLLNAGCPRFAERVRQRLLEIDF